MKLNLILACTLIYLVVQAYAVDDNNPCRKINLFDPYVNKNVTFDLSKLIDQYVINPSYKSLANYGVS